MWVFFKCKTAMTIFNDVEDLQCYLAEIIVTDVTFDQVKSICGNQFYKNSFKKCFIVQMV
jgi:hypothetical protein